MRVSRIYQAGSIKSGAIALLDARAAHYVAHVLRLRPEDELVLFDGSGRECRARVVSVRKSEVEVAVDHCVERSCESPLATVLAQGISRGERMDYAIQKAVELGVQHIVPLLAGRSVVKLDGERRERRVEHWQAVAISAAEQCGRNLVPTIDPVIGLDAWLATARGLRLVLHAEGARRLSELPRPDESVTLLVGPEGGLSDAEIESAIQCGCVPVRLGPRILRTETAGVAALTALQTLWGDLG